jgi:cell division protease FtsH
MQCSQECAAKVDAEVLSIIKSCHEKARAILSENEELLYLLAEALLERETMTGEEFNKIVEEYMKAA